MVRSVNLITYQKRELRYIALSYQQVKTEKYEILSHKLE